MKFLITILTVLSINLLGQINKNQVIQNYNANKSNVFIENKGQWPEEVLYLTKIGGMNAWITKTGVVYDYYKIERNYSEEEAIKLAPYEKDEFERNNTSIKGHVVRMNLANSKPFPEATAKQRQETYYNYFIGNDESKWASFVGLFEDIEITEVYEGIGIRYYFDEGLLRYDFHVKPNADLSQLQFELEGVDNYFINENGELAIQTSLGEVTHGKLYAYQESNEIACSFAFTKEGTLGIKVNSYDKSKNLVIDPLVYSTYLGGSLIERPNSISTDNSGKIFVIGDTQSSNFPTTNGAYQSNYGGGDIDVFVSKFSSDGDELENSTFIGGAGSDLPSSLVMDETGSLFISGGTTSNNFPTTQGAFQTNLGELGSNSFVIKINNNLDNIVFSTFLFSNSNSPPNEIKLDASGNILIVGTAYSEDFLTTIGAYQSTYGGGSGDAYLMKLNQNGTDLIFSTYLGGSSHDYGRSLVIENSGNILVTGETYSSDFPTTTGAYETSHKENYDCFISKLSSDGSSVINSTLIGGNNVDYSRSITLDASGNVFIGGYTGSTNFPTTTGAYQTSFGGGQHVTFVTKFTNNLAALVYSTYLGGSGIDRLSEIILDEIGNIIVTGYTTSSNFPVTIGAFQTSWAFGYDAFITKLSSSGKSLVYSTFIGGNSSNDYGISMSKSNSNNVALVGQTNSTNFPTTTGAYQTSFGGELDCFIMKFSLPNVDFTLNSPIGTEIFEGNTFHNITWTEDYSPADMKIELSIDNGSNWISLTTVQYNKLNYIWQVIPLDVSQAKIRLYPEGFEELAQESGTFQITTSTADRVTLTSQNSSGNKYKIGTSQNITWEKVGSVSSVKLEYTTDKGETWNLIANNVDASLLSYSWTIPDAPTDWCKIKVTDSNTPTVYDFSDSFFAIKEVTNNSFNSSARYKGGSQETITWTSNSVDNVRLYYSTNNGTNWTYIAQATASTGTYDWTIPQLNSTECLVKIEDASDATLFDISDNTFEIWYPRSGAQTPTVGQNTLSFGNAINNLEMFAITATEITSIFNPYESPVDGTLPNGINNSAQYFWTISASGISFINGKISVPLSELTGVTDASKLRWLKRSNSGDAWTDIGGEVVGGLLKSTVTFTTFSEFTIGSTDNSNPLPVELTSFSGSVQESKVLLKWETATEVNNYGFDIERTLLSENDETSWEKLGFLEGHGNSNSAKSYRFQDESVENTNKYKYRLKQIDLDGSFKYSDEIEITFVPTKYELFQNYPNPFNPTTNIKFSLPEKSIVELKIYNILGEMVNTIINTEMEAGYHKVELHGSNLSSGVYLYTISMGKYFDVKKMLLIK